MDEFPSLPASLGDRPALVDRIEYVLRELIGGLDAGPPEQRGRGAPGILPAVCLWAGMLVCVLRGFSRQLDLWRLLALHGLWDYPIVPVCDEAVYDRLARSGDTPMAILFVRITEALRARLAPFGATTLAPFARAVIALDETTLDAVTRHLPAYRCAKGRARLPGRLATLFDLRLQQFCRVQVIDEVNEREQLHARDLATLIIAQILLGLWVEVAGRAEVDVFDVSLALLVRHAPLLATAGRDPVAVLVAEGRRTGIIRPASRRRYETPSIPPDRLTPAPPNLVLTRPARHATGQGSIPITPADTIIHAPPQPPPIDPHRRGRGQRTHVP
jgi:hypothetical protein